MGVPIIHFGTSHERIVGFQILESIISRHLQTLDSDNRNIHMIGLEHVIREIIESIHLCSDEKKICLSALSPINEPILFCLFKKIL